MNMETNAERLERLSRQRGNYGSDVHRHAAIKVDDFQWLIEQVGENDHLRNALAFYADDATYKTNVTDQWEPITPVVQDKGEKAKKALGGEQ